MQTGWKSRLEEWAPEPPAMGWERLSEQLEDKPLFAQKLHNYSSVPPTDAWEAIQKKMEPEAISAPVIRMLPRNKWIRYGSVAASLLFAFFIFRQYNTTAPNSGVSRHRAPVESTIVPLPDNRHSSQDVASEIVTRATSTAPSNNRFTQATYSLLPGSGSGPIPYAQPARNNDSRLYDVVPTSYLVADEELERYMVVSVADDAAVRLPKKLYDLFRCGEVPLPAGCTELVLQLKQRVANPSLVTTADFAGVMEMVQQVD
ncbi:hypothetical protein SAMN05444008_106251 [Cnuella takakiae]|uniref:Transmembrane protein n=1 Tax=Cnuella takakiae TaxID=1302690 RepID=A0A1M5AG81_9BACT|nr:hypothetical protein [Cnuella takakiae]OLY91974.1 hypothetical protein BUE76_08750 [Cnuella takakiae]SHF29263.1 hypothetical protein SAMN05444008_106251 [Cnuella takakiae]